MTNKTDVNECSAALHGYPRGSLTSAMNARKDEAIGEVVKKWSGYSVGDFVFVEAMDSGNGWIVSMPMTPEQIDEQKAKGSLLRDWLTVICVPFGHVRMVLPQGG